MSRIQCQKTWLIKCYKVGDMSTNLHFLSAVFKTKKPNWVDPVLTICNHNVGIKNPCLQCFVMLTSCKRLTSECLLECTCIAIYSNRLHQSIDCLLVIAKRACSNSFIMLILLFSWSRLEFSFSLHFKVEMDLIDDKTRVSYFYTIILWFIKNEHEHGWRNNIIKVQQSVGYTYIWNITTPIDA